MSEINDYTIRTELFIKNFARKKNKTFIYASGPANADKINHDCRALYQAQVEKSLLVLYDADIFLHVFVDELEVSSKTYHVVLVAEDPLPEWFTANGYAKLENY